TDDRIAAAVRAIGLLGDASAVPSLLPLLSCDQPDLLGRAALALGRLKAKEAVKPLLALLDKDDSSNVPFPQVLGALARVGDPAAFAPLQAFYLSRPAYRRQAVLAIAQLDGPAATKFLVDRAKSSDDEFEVRLALDALVRHATTIHGNADLGEAALAALTRQPSDLRVKALELIQHVRWKPAADAVLKLCASSDSSVMRAAAEAIGWVGDQSALETLHGLMKNDDPTLKLVVAVSLARLGEKGPLLAQLAAAKKAVADAPTDHAARFELGLIDLYAKDDKSGAAEFARLVKDQPDDYTSMYNLACAESLLGEPDAATADLKKSIQGGQGQWQDMSWHMDLDDDLDAIRDLPAVKAMLDDLRKSSNDGLLNDGLDDETSMEWPGMQGQQVFFGQGQ
ncbi:MAG: HEAT repeat domain-containing protein, partial [Polyangiaceae bacterium]